MEFSRVIYKAAALCYLPIFKLKNRKKAHFGLCSYIDRNVRMEGMNAIGKHTAVYGYSSLGYGSYIGTESSFRDTQIGRFTCIADHVRLICGRHPASDYVSIHPAFFSLNKQVRISFVSKQKFEEYNYVDKEKLHRLVIGNDVWIGSHALLLDGIRIGDGAIIAAGAVVIKDVPPYAIVGGCPARIIRYRFIDDQIRFLLEYRWWEKDIAWLNAHADLFEDIQVFMEAINKYE